MGFKAICPKCQGRNFWKTPENDTAYCFNCGYLEKGENAQPLQRSPHIKEIREYYTETAQYYHSCLDTAHREYLNKRGITDASIEQYKIGFAPNEKHIRYHGELARESGLAGKDMSPFLADRIVFPYWVKGVVTDMRARAWGANEIKYLSPHGTAFVRGADYPFNYETLQHDHVVITEGDPKCIVSEQIGVHCISLPGIFSMRPMLKQRQNQKFTICFDNQLSNYYDVIRGIKRLAGLFDDLRIATLPLMNREKMDVDSYILDFGADAYKKVIRRALNYTEWIKLVRP
jgi:DNA primase